MRPKDRPETGLQGQVPMNDRATGRAVEGHTCNPYYCRRVVEAAQRARAAT